MAEYAALTHAAQLTGGKIFFADEAHFRADAELRGKWVLKGEPAPRFQGAGSGGLEQPAAWREGQLLLGGVPGDGGGGVDGTGGQQQLRDLGRLPDATEGKILRAAEGDLGQRAGPPRGGGAGVSSDARTASAAGEPPFSRGQALPGYSPDFNADEAGWGWVREEATGNLFLGSKALVQSLPLRRQGRGSTTSSAVWPAGETKLNGAAGPPFSQGPTDSGEIPSPIHHDP